MKGARAYDWTTIAVTLAGQRPADGHAHTVLIRRGISDPSDPSEIEFFLAHALIGTPVAELIGVAGLRWKIEENNETGKDLLGLTEYQVRKWAGWHRHVTTVMLALAFLAVSRARLAEQVTSEPVLSAADQGKGPQPWESLG
jgi:SRSO17 transposase